MRQETVRWACSLDCVMLHVAVFEHSTHAYCVAYCVLLCCVAGTMSWACSGRDHCDHHNGCNQLHDARFISLFRKDGACTDIFGKDVTALNRLAGRFWSVIAPVKKASFGARQKSAQEEPKDQYLPIKNWMELFSVCLIPLSLLVRCACRGKPQGKPCCTLRVYHSRFCIPNKWLKATE